MENIRGGLSAHVLRRAFHVSMLAVPFIYYDFFITHVSKKIVDLTLLAIVFFIFLFEKLRIRMKLVLFAQRFHEANRISAFAWTMLGLVIVTFFAPKQFGMPIIMSCAIADPLMGELRLRSVNTFITIFSGFSAVSVVWCIGAAIFHFSLWYALILAPVTVAAEWPQLKWVDDNVLMLVVPLLVTFIL